MFAPCQQHAGFHSSGLISFSGSAEFPNVVLKERSQFLTFGLLEQGFLVSNQVALSDSLATLVLLTHHLDANVSSHLLGIEAGRHSKFFANWPRDLKDRDTRPGKLVGLVVDAIITQNVNVAIRLLHHSDTHRVKVLWVNGHVSVLGNINSYMAGHNMVS